MLLSRPAQQVSRGFTHHSSPTLLSVFFARCSDLSLCGMHPSPVPDAEAHGKDGNKRPEQLYFPNGEVLPSFHSCPLVFVVTMQVENCKQTLQSSV